VIEVVEVIKVVKTFRDLTVWEKAHALALEIYKLTASFPPRECFGLVSQMRRAGVSIAANIAEGQKRKTTKEFSRFLNISEGSLEELKYYLILSQDLNYISPDNYKNLQPLCNEVGRLLHYLTASLPR